LLGASDGALLHVACADVRNGSSLTNFRFGRTFAVPGAAGRQVSCPILRVETIDEEIKALNEGKKEVFAEAKSQRPRDRASM